ncbi:MAG: DUF4423 domain-containing protein [Pseudomonadota bacterium]|nr:DUF4423 domain-containing protein [Pseudomonadota bacterium]
MKFNWDASEYREIVNDYLGFKEKRRPRGAIKKFADHLRCHSTFIAQVLSERANFSLEQGLDAATYFGFSDEEKSFFLAMIMRDRAATVALKRHSQEKLNHILEAKRDLKPKTKVSTKIELSEAEYYGNWIYQAIHAFTQIEQFQTAPAIAKALGTSLEEVISVLGRLKLMGLVTSEKISWKSTTNFLHLTKDSAFIRYMHTTWKTKILADMQNKSKLDGTRYSGLLTMSEKDYQKVRDVLAETIRNIRKIAETSVSDKVYIISFDCYKM